MIKEIEEFLKRSHEHDAACLEYAMKIKNANSVLETFDIGIRTPCLEYLCKSIDDGWGLEKESIERVFSHYINGKYIHRGKYSSALYCGFDGVVTAKETVYCFIGCDDATLDIEEEWRMCKVFVAGGTNLKIIGKGTAFVDFCGQDCKIDNKLSRA